MREITFTLLFLGSFSTLLSQNQLNEFTNVSSGTYTYSYMNKHTGDPKMYKGKDKKINVTLEEGRLKSANVDGVEWYPESSIYARVLRTYSQNDLCMAYISNDIYTWKGGTNPNDVVINGIFKTSGYEEKGVKKYESIIKNYLKNTNQEYGNHNVSENDVLVNSPKYIVQNANQKANEEHRMKPEVYAAGCSQMMDYPSLESAFAFLYGPFKTSVFNIEPEAVKTCWPLYVEALKQNKLRFKDTEDFYVNYPNKDFLVERELLAQKVLLENGFMKEERLSGDSLYSQIDLGNRSSHKTSFFGEKIENLPIAYDFSGRKEGEKGAEVEIYVDEASYNLFNTKCFKVEIRYMYEDDLEWTIIKKYVEASPLRNDFLIAKDHVSRLIINLYGEYEGSGANVTVYHTKKGSGVFYGREFTNSARNERPLGFFNSTFKEGIEIYENKGTYKKVEDEDIIFTW